MMMALTGNELENWNADTNYQIIYHGLALLGRRGPPHIFHLANLV